MNVINEKKTLIIFRIISQGLLTTVFLKFSHLLVDSEFNCFPFNKYYFQFVSGYCFQCEPEIVFDHDSSSLSRAFRNCRKNQNY